jgi:predicted nucleic acid-binding Zn ribbon protein
VTGPRRPGRRRSTGPDDDPTPVGEALGSVSAELGLPDPVAMGALSERWADIVGDALAPHARLRSLRGGLLTIAVDAAPWATELRYLEAVLRRRVEEVTGRDVVRSVRVVVDPPS